MNRINFYQNITYQNWLKEKKEYLNIPKPTKEMNMPFKIFPQRKTQAQIALLVNFFSNFKKEITPIVHKYLYRKEETFPHSFYKVK